MGIFVKRANGTGAIIALVASGMVQYMVKEFTDIHLLLYSAIGTLNQNIKANKLINEHLASDNFLGVTTGLYVENCGTYVSGGGFINKSDQKRTPQRHPRRQKATKAGPGRPSRGQGAVCAQLRKIGQESPPPSRPEW